MASKNVIEPGKDIFENIRGRWNDFFGNNNELVIELACGWGEYTLSLAEKFPDKNFIGIDIKG
ncbi:MAG: tRNA (guanosine(46)-N7)-methyltransferase TrmB, partial [Bacteroidota bacterium]